MSGDIQHKTTLAHAPGWAFDDDGTRVATADFAYPGDDPTEAAVRGDVREALLEFLHDLTADSTALQAGQYLFALAHLCGQSGCETDGELAAKMGVSASRVSHILAELPLDFTGLLRCNRRQRKPTSATSRH